MTQTFQAAVSCELLPWDSEFFGCRIARVTADTLNEDQVSALDQWSRNERIRCLYFLARADCPTTIQIAERHGFNLVDLRLTLESKVGQASRLPSGSTRQAAADLARTQNGAHRATPYLIRSAGSADVPVLETLARTVHHDTRFFSDPHFSRRRAEELYATWIRQDCEKHAATVREAESARTCLSAPHLGGAASSLFAAHRNGHAIHKAFVAAKEAEVPVGYISCHLDIGLRIGQIGLIGVAPQVRNQGLGKALVMAALSWLASQGAETITVVTQGRNLGAQRLYQQCGFITRELQLWYHRWYAPWPADKSPMKGGSIRRGVALPVRAQEQHETASHA